MQTDITLTGKTPRSRIETLAQFFSAGRDRSIVLGLESTRFEDIYSAAALSNLLERWDNVSILASGSLDPWSSATALSGHRLIVAANARLLIGDLIQYQPANLAEHAGENLWRIREDYEPHGHEVEVARQLQHRFSARLTSKGIGVELLADWLERGHTLSGREIVALGIGDSAV